MSLFCSTNKIDPKFLQHPEMSGILQYNLNTSKIPPLSKNDRYFAVKIDPKFYLKIIIIPAILNSHLEFEIPFELVWLKNDGEKWSRKNYFEIPRAPSELLLPSAEKSAQKG